LVILLVGFLVYRNKNKEEGSNLFSDIFSILPSSRDATEVEAIAGVTIQKNEPVYVSGVSEDGRLIVSPYRGDASSLGEIYGYATKDFSIGDIGEYELNENYKYGQGNFKTNQELIDVIAVDYKFECSDGIDNDDDGNIDAGDPNCHAEGNINKEYLPNYYSEETTIETGGWTDPDFSGGGTGSGFPPGGGGTGSGFPPGGGGTGSGFPPGGGGTGSVFPPGGGFDPVCSDGIDNDDDGDIDADDSACHLDGDINKEYLPNHFSENISTSSYIDLTASSVTYTEIKLNEPAVFYTTITNMGSNKIEEEFDSFFSVKKVGEDVEDIENKAFVVPSPLGAGEGYPASFKFLIPDTPDTDETDEYLIRACADKKDASDEGKVKEFNEENNCGPWVPFKADTSITPPSEKDLPECSDTIDNDGDGKIDRDDPNCREGGVLTGTYLPDYDSESKKPSECSDTIDNDGDGKIDIDDPTCREGGIPSGRYLPNYDSESEKPTECSDTIDNDGDEEIDEGDPGCHEGGTLSGNYILTHDSEEIAPAKPNICLSLEPLEFTEEEKAKLDELLRKYYLIAPTLKGEVDINLAYLDMIELQNLFDQVENLTVDCTNQIEQVIENGREDLIVQYGNPWYMPEDRGSYLEKLTKTSQEGVPSEEEMERLLPQCNYDKSVEEGSGAPLTDKYDTPELKQQVCRKLAPAGQLFCEYYNARGKAEGESENVANILLNILGVDPLIQATAGAIRNVFYDSKEWVLWQTGCKWDNYGKVDLKEYEMLLNVW
jgi:hypothetical protein